MPKRPLPSPWDAPALLLATEGSCGLLAAWVTLRHFRRRTSAERLIRACGHTRRHGVFPIALACAFHEYGLEVIFHSDPDPMIQPFERRFYSRAWRLGIAIQPAITLDSLLTHIVSGSIVIVLHDTPDGEGHLAIVTGATNDAVGFHDDRTLSRAAFQCVWDTPGTLRQSIVVAHSPKRGSLPRVGPLLSVANEA